MTADQETMDRVAEVISANLTVIGRMTEAPNTGRVSSTTRATSARSQRAGGTTSTPHDDR